MPFVQTGTLCSVHMTLFGPLFYSSQGRLIFYSSPLASAHLLPHRGCWAQLELPTHPPE